MDMARVWRVHPHDQSRSASLANAAKISPVIAQLLICRGITEPAAIQSFLNPKLGDLRDPESLPGIPRAVEALAGAIRAGKKITVYGDYDVDGITATSILVQCLKVLGAQVNYHVPHRIDDGYGLNNAALETLASRGTEFVVTVDCGVTGIQEVETATRLGMEIVVTDHHEMGPQLPRASAIVHPRLPGSNYPFSGLSGSGVALKVAWALCRHFSQGDRVLPAMKERLVQAVILASLGTIADVVPLLDENRVLVQQGMRLLKESTQPGIKALMEVCKLTGKKRLDTEDVGFQMAPRLNAAGRLGQASLAVELLTTDNQERAVVLANYLNELNADRQRLERSVYTLAQQQLKEQGDLDASPAFVLAGRGWHQGVIGIVAGRIAEKYHRPTVILSLDEMGGRPAVGSARSVHNVPLHLALEACSTHLLSHGGHAAAAGLKIMEENLDSFRSDFCDYVSQTVSSGNSGQELWIDAEVMLSSLTLNVVRQLEVLAPFGKDNPRPLFVARDVALANSPARIGTNGSHLSLRLSQGGAEFKGIAFGRGDAAEELAASNQPLNVAFRPIINDFRGRQNVEMQLVDWRTNPTPAVVSI